MDVPGFSAKASQPEGPRPSGFEGSFDLEGCGATPRLKSGARRAARALNATESCTVMPYHPLGSGGRQWRPPAVHPSPCGRFASARQYPAY